MFEKRLAAIPPQSFTADGSDIGVVKVYNATLFRVKQEVLLNGTALPTAELEVKAVLDLKTLIVGPRGSSIKTTFNISAYTVAAGANISAVEQKRPTIPQEDIARAVYEEEPIVAIRGIAVDETGGIRSATNPTPVESNTWWNEADISRDGDDDITKVEFLKDTSLVETIDLQYNGEKSVTKVIKT